MKEPYLRPAAPDGQPGPPCPPGHEAQAAGVWRGKQMDVVYDPRRHDVALIRGGLSVPAREGLAKTGWRLRMKDGDSEMWTRDRMVVARTRLERAVSAPRAPRIA